MENTEKLLNPDIRDITYGKKELKTLTLYPLSVGDQFKVTDIVTKVVQDLVRGQQEGKTGDFAFMTVVIEALEKNLGQVLTIVADISEKEAKAVISQLTNTQFANVVESIWVVDYEPMLKKGKSLLERGKSLFGSRKSLQDSSDTTLNTGSKTSTGLVTTKEE